jgi:hypothetical protein
MGYFTRVFGVENLIVSIEKLEQSLINSNLEAIFELTENETAENWTVIDVLNNKGEPLMQIERNPIIDGELGKYELEEFKEFIVDEQPNSSVKWLLGFFEKAKTIYSFQILSAAYEDDNFDIIDNIRTTIWKNVGGIFQADNEGFSNEEGYHILWQFSDDVEGDWNMAVKTMFGWSKFIMDLGNQEQRVEFFKGKVPKTAKKI